VVTAESSTGAGLTLSPSGAAINRAIPAGIVAMTGALRKMWDTARNRGVVSTTLRRSPSFSRAVSTIP
jgi:hypothetical protein